MVIKFNKDYCWKECTNEGCDYKEHTNIGHDYQDIKEGNKCIRKCTYCSNILEEIDWDERKCMVDAFMECDFPKEP